DRVTRGGSLPRRRRSCTRPVPRKGARRQVLETLLRVWAWQPPSQLTARRRTVQRAATARHRLTSSWSPT
ncbi:unnamed protein product, partial [Polarella glacialis]